MSIKKVFLTILPWAVVGAIAVLFTKALSSNWDKIDADTFHFNYLAIVGIALLILAVITSGLLWGGLLRTLTRQPVARLDAIRIHSASWILKYIPGQVGSILNKLAWAKRNNISQKATATSFVYENVFTLIASILVSLPLLFVIGDTFSVNGAIYLPLLSIIPIALILYRPIFHGLLNYAFKLLKKKPFTNDDFLSAKDILLFSIKYLVPRIINAVGFVFIAASIVVIDPSMYVGLGATYVLASVIGLLAIFIPGGLGVREGVIVALASIYLPIEQAIVLSLVARLYSTIADGGVGLVYLILNKGRIKQQ